MSIAICRVDKCSSAHDIAGIQIHNRRERQHSNSNPDIDFTLSSNNHSLCGRAKGKSYNAAINEIIAAEYTSNRAIRKDAVRMVQVLFTSDSDFFLSKPIEEQKKFFDDCYEWASNRWGESHIISADVHMDEKTPHMHLNFVPLVKDVDKKTGNEITTLNVHKAVGSGSKALQQLQDDFYNAVGKKWGLDRGSKADLTTQKPRKNQRTEQYKESTNYHQNNINDLENRSQALQTTIGNYQDNINALESQSQALQTTINDYSAILQAEPQNAVEGVPVPPAAKFVIGKENKDKLLYSPEDIANQQELAKAAAVIAADNQSKAAALSQREAQIERDSENIIAKAKDEAADIINAAKENAAESTAAANSYYFRMEREAKAKMSRADDRICIATEQERKVALEKEQTAHRISELDKQEHDIEQQKQKLEQQASTLFELENRPDKYYQGIINELQSQNNDLELEILSLNAQLDQAKTDFDCQKELTEQVIAEKTDLQQVIKSKNQQNDELSERIRILEEELASKDRTISSLQSDKQSLKAAVDKNYNLFMAACDVGEYYDDNFVDKTSDRFAGDSISDIFRDRNRGYDR